MKTMTALACLCVALAVTCQAALPAEPDCEEVTYVEMEKEVLVKCVQVVPRLNCVEKQVDYEEPVDADCEAGEVPAPEGAEPGPKVCEEPATETKTVTVKVQCTELVLVTTCEPRLVRFMMPVDSPACSEPEPTPVRSSAAPRVGLGQPVSYAGAIPTPIIDSTPDTGVSVMVNGCCPPPQPTCVGPRCGLIQRIKAKCKCGSYH